MRKQKSLCVSVKKMEITIVPWYNKAKCVKREVSMQDDILLKTWFHTVALEEYEHVQRLCRYLILGAGFDISLADDLTQQVFCTAWMKRENLRQHPALRAWLYKTVRYTFNNFLRRQLYLQKMHAMSLDEPNALECLKPQSEDVLETLLADEPSDAMQPILNQLSHKDNLLYYHLYMNPQDIPSLCQSFGVSEKTLKKRIYRLHQRLIQLLEKENFFEVSKLRVTDDMYKVKGAL